jgi:cell fate (sporulation/competence/biofilm development) regulator YmcA (YheA/YmcA/DUF963 family)
VHLAEKFAKSANITTKVIVFRTVSVWISKNIELDADSNPLKKYQKVFTKKVRGLRTFLPSTKK